MPLRWSRRSAMTQRGWQSRMIVLLVRHAPYPPTPIKIAPRSRNPPLTALSDNMANTMYPPVATPRSNIMKKGNNRQRDMARFTMPAGMPSALHWGQETTSSWFTRGDMTII